MSLNSIFHHWFCQNFLLTLKAKAEDMERRFPGSVDLAAMRSCSTISQFDTAVVAKLFGFSDNVRTARVSVLWLELIFLLMCMLLWCQVDYYRQCGAKWWLSKIRVPAIVINANDDPFMDATSYPSQYFIGEAPVRVICHDHGGHCGFMAAYPPSQHGWLADEMANVLHHIVQAHQHNRSA